MSVKYVGADVHGQATVFHVVDWKGQNLICGTTTATRKDAVLGFIRGLGGEVHLALEEGTQARWFQSLVKPFVKEVVVCSARHNKRSGPMRNKNDSGDAKALALLLKSGGLVSVYQGEDACLVLRERVRSYRVLVEDVTRIKNRIKAVYRSQGVMAKGIAPFGTAKRQTYLEEIESCALKERLAGLYCLLDVQNAMVNTARTRMLETARKHIAYRLLRTIPGIGPIGASILVAIIGTPFRFPTKQAFWSYCGLGVVYRESGEYQVDRNGNMIRRSATRTRGLNRGRNGQLKEVFKTAALVARTKSSTRAYYERQLKRGLPEEIARVQLARKLATTALTLWKKGCKYDDKKLEAEIK